MAKRRPAAVQVRAVYGVDPLIAAQCHYSHALWFLGHSDRAQATMHDGLARSPDQWVTLHPCRGALQCGAAPGLLSESRGRRRAGGEDHPLSTVHEFAFWHAMMTILAGWAEMHLGRVREGIAAIERGLTAYRATGARTVCTYFLAFLAERVGAPVRTPRAGSGGRGLILAETTLDRGYEPELWRLKGELLLASQPSAPPRFGARTRRKACRDSGERSHAGGRALPPARTRVGARGADQVARAAGGGESLAGVACPRTRGRSARVTGRCMQLVRSRCGQCGSGRCANTARGARDAERSCSRRFPRRRQCLSAALKYRPSFLRLSRLREAALPSGRLSAGTDGLEESQMDLVGAIAVRSRQNVADLAEGEAKELGAEDHRDCAAHGHGSGNRRIGTGSR